MKISYKLLIILIVVAGVFLLLEFINGRADFWDFRVYYDAASEFANGNSPYGQAYGVSSGFYKYAPVSLLIFVPFTWLPYSFAAVIFYSIIAFSFGLLMSKIHKFLTPFIPSKSKKEYLPFIITSVIVSAHIIRELHLGNINLILLLLYFIAFKMLIEKREFLAGVLITIGIFIKPHFVVLLPLLVLKSKWKSIFSVIISSAILLFLPVIILGYSGNNELLNEWFVTMQGHNGELMTSPNTIYGLFSNHILAVFNVEPFNNVVIILLSLVALGIFGIVINNKYRGGRVNGNISMYLEYFLIVALIPNLTHTDTEHFLWSLPIIMLLIYLIMSIKNIRKRIILAVLTLIFTFPWYLNSPDILSKSVITFLNESGFLGLSNLFIIALTLYLFYKKKNEFSSY